MNELLSLCRAYSKYFDIGAAVNTTTIVQNADILKQHFNSVTCENEMKYGRVQPEEGHFTFEDADKIVAFAKENHMHIRGHAPVWHNQTPDWFHLQGGRPAPRELVYERLDAHIKTVAEHFGDAVYCWDVVNEATTDTVPERHLQRYGNEVYRQTKYLNACGIEYLEKAYHLMRKYSPNALDVGAPLQGFGMQNHYSIYSPEIDEVKKSIETYASLGLRIHVTEMDLSCYRSWDDPEIEPTDEIMDLQAKRYEALFELYRSYSDVIDSVTFWGVADDTSWLARGSRKNWPLIFDMNGQPKPVLERLIRAAE